MSPCTSVGALASGCSSHGAPGRRLVSVVASTETSAAARQAGNDSPAAGLGVTAFASKSGGCSNCSSHAGCSCREQKTLVKWRLLRKLSGHPGTAGVRQQMRTPHRTDGGSSTAACRASRLSSVAHAASGASCNESGAAPTPDAASARLRTTVQSSACRSVSAARSVTSRRDPALHRHLSRRWHPPQTEPTDRDPDPGQFRGLHHARIPS